MKYINFNQQFLKDFNEIDLLFDDDLSKRELAVFNYLLKYPNYSDDIFTFLIENNILPFKILLRIVFNIALADGMNKKNEKEVIDKIINGQYDDYNKMLDSYNNLLQKWINCFNEFMVGNSLDLSNFFTYLLWNGYFNYNQYHQYQMENRVHIDNIHSLTIMQGNGVCLNYSDMLRDLLNKSGYSSATIINYNRGIKNIQNYLLVKRKVVPFKMRTRVLQKVLKNFMKNQGNHACTLINDQSDLYIYDSTNLLVLDLLSPNKAKAINGDGEIDLKYYISYCFTNNETERSALDKLREYDYSTSFCSVEKLEEISIKDRELFFDNNKLINDCYQETLEDISIINQKVKLLNKK